MKVNSSDHVDIELSASTPHPLSGDPLQIQRSFVNSDKDQLHITDAARQFVARTAVEIEIDKSPTHPIQIKKRNDSKENANESRSVTFFINNKRIKESIKTIWLNLNPEEQEKVADKLNMKCMLDTCAAQHHILPDNQEAYNYFAKQMTNLETRTFNAESISGIIQHKSKLGAYLGVPHNLHSVDTNRPVTRVVTSWGILKAVMKNKVGVHNPPETDTVYFDFLTPNGTYAKYPVGKLSGRIFEL